MTPRSIIVAIALAVGCAPLQAAADPALSAQAREVWAEVGGHPGVRVDAVPAIGSPAAAYYADGRARMFVAVGLPVRLQMRYELAKLAWLVGDGSALSTLTYPVRLLEAALHGPVSESLSWRAVLFPPPPPKPPGDPPHAAR